MLAARILEVGDGLISDMRRDSIMAFAFSGEEKWSDGVPM